MPTNNPAPPSSLSAATPGPWQVAPDCSDYTVNGVKFDALYDARGHKLALLFTTAEESALLSAAPALRDALARIVAWDDAGCDPSQKSIDAARTLLATLPGGSTDGR